MPVERFAVTVGVSNEVATDAMAAVAEASRYLAYADQTDTFGYGGRVEDVTTHLGGDGVYEWSITLQFTAPIVSDEEREKFLSEMETLAHVEEAERLSATKP